ncbi:MAG TPA: DUF6635 family protein [Acetobacteraceae bacterium]|nr:DUF6635 family protein [Acetobacteraceae bacterium]
MSDGQPTAPPLRDGEAGDIVSDAIRAYFAQRQARVRAFVDRTYSLRGSLRLHRAALGADILRAPANLLLAGPHAAFKAAGLLAARLGAQRAARYARTRQLILRTDVACEIEWRLFTELLELPCEQPGRESRRDALAEAILADPRVTGAAGALLAGIGRQAEEPAFRARLAEAMATYAGTRAAAAEITTSLLTLSSGALALKQLTPGAASLGPALAALIAQQSAIASFPLGAGLGGIWFGLFPAAPGFGLVAALTGGLMLAASFTAAFAGIVADPVQRRLGLHEKRLRRMLAALEAQMLDPASPGFAVHDHYVARLLDLFDMLGSAWRLAHP